MMDAITELRTRGAGLSTRQEKLALANDVAAKYGMEPAFLMQINLYERQNGRLPGEGDFDGLVGFGRELGAGMLLEGADELEAGFRSLFEDENFGQILDDINRERAFYKARNPGTALGANIGGAVGGAVAASLLAPAKLALLASRPLTAGLGVSTAAGGVAGFAGGEGSAGERARNIPGGLAFGAAGGLAGYGAGRALSAGYNKLRGNTIDMKVGRALADDNVSPDDVIANINRNEAADAAAGRTGQEVLADYGGEATRSLLRGARVSSPAARNDIRQTLDTRQRGTDMSVTGAGAVPMQSQRIVQDIDEAKGIFADVAPIVSQLQTRQYRAPGVGEKYTRAFAENGFIKDIDTLSMLYTNPRFRKAYAQARQNMIIRTSSDPIRQREIYMRYPEDVADLFQFDKRGQIIGLDDGYPDGLDLEFLDKIKRLEGEEIFDAETPRQLGGKNKNMADARSALNDYKNLLIKSAGGSKSPYGEALRVTADAFQLGDALKAADKIMKKPVNEAKSIFAKMSEIEKDVVRVKFLEDMIESVKKVRSGSNARATIDDTAKRREQLDFIFEGKPEALKNFMSRLSREQAMFDTRSRVMTGSETMDKGVDLTNILAAGAQLDLGSALRIGRDAVGAARNLSLPSTARRTAGSLLEQNQAAQRAQMERVKRLDATLDAQRRLVGGTTLGGSLLGSGFSSRQR